MLAAPKRPESMRVVAGGVRRLAEFSGGTLRQRPGPQRVRSPN